MFFNNIIFLFIYWGGRSTHEHIPLVYDIDADIDFIEAGFTSLGSLDGQKGVCLNA